MASASVIVPARDAESTLPRTLASLAAQDFPGEFEVLVVDDGSSDGTVEVAEAAPGPVTVLRQHAQGPAEARNLAAEHASGEALAFCDADVYPEPGWLRAGVAALETADLVQGHVVPDDTVPLGPFDRTLWILSEVGLWQTANLFATRAIFDAIGGFEDWLEVDIGKVMAEDVWFGWRAKRAGASSAFCAEARAFHAVFPRDWRGYVDERRRLLYFPAMAAKTPELREHFFYRRLFLSRRSAAFALFAVGVSAAAALRSPLPLALGLPYARIARRRAAPFGRAPGAVELVDLVADAVSLTSMLRGSARYRSPLI